MAGFITGQFWRLGIFLGAVPVLAAGLFSWHFVSKPEPDQRVTAKSGYEAIAYGSQPQVSNPAAETPLTPPGATGNEPGTGDVDSTGTGNDFPALSGFESGATEFLSAGPSDEPPGSSSGGDPPNPQPVPPPVPPPVQTGTLSGFVWQTDIPDGPLDGISVTLLHADTCCSSEVMTNEQGGFAFSGLAPGGYRLLFDDRRGLYENSWYGDEDTPHGTIIYVTGDGETKVIHQLKAVKNEGEISGRVTALGRGVARVHVLVYLVDGAGMLLDTVAGASSEEDGAYTIANLPPTQPGFGYKVFFSPPAYSGYASQWYQGQNKPEGAKIMSLNPGDKITGIDAQLEAGGITILTNPTFDFMTDAAGGPASEGNAMDQGSDDIGASNENEQQVLGQGSEDQIPAGEPQADGSRKAGAQLAGQGA